ncbi:schwannomin-interacting protein 1-like isoform X1 [Toxotes jaculatrix]|uniref:schwannomin-interacting protein 1-like isoform X1 n=1 Tax=Toxotes jaculatrix TaxID=941984 RepID=UPI001B3AAECF|nr:schwannomin-interacting protein 1-like isoform X1 [Toxotes jaculatrix]
MEGEKETAEEKEEEEEEEEEEKELHHRIAAAASTDHQDLPIMHWEDLSQRIAELEKQEQERQERSKVSREEEWWYYLSMVQSAGSGYLSVRGTGVRMEDSQGGVWRGVWEEEEEDFRRCRVAVVTSRFHNHRNLQLCFINNSDSEDEEEGADTKISMGTGRNGCHPAGLKQEVATALRTLRDKLLAEQKEKERLAGSSGVAKRKHLERWELQECSVQQLSSLRASLQQDVHALSSELVAHLLVRDQLRTKQDAMLLDVQDLT